MGSQTFRLLQEWHFGVRVSTTKKLVAFISGVPMTLGSFHSEINYICVHKKLRSKRLAPVLIKEVTRPSTRNISSHIHRWRCNPYTDLCLLVLPSFFQHPKTPCAWI
ncbi:Myristoyl-CoA:protein N-myristoyltransferase, N-terminal domain-containing protein [Mycena alexandri]|uniref:Glycylpeptide N-tetradecanoyltransferase n=1 Tax=Mycena alexandri TaxID=1745969 RepID=A0AAD6THV3_9AGAR|nr:Myristoyl-CoA:protein N-myristoyltransferase, N-terminal domain-containing protein [Mycena alexandri]